MANVVVALLLLIVLVVDPSVHLPYYTPKVFILLVAPSALLLCYLFLRFIKKESQSFSVSLIELLLFFYLAWSVITKPEIVSGPSGLRVWMMLSAVVLTVLVRQISQANVQVFIKKFLYGLWFIGSVESLIGFYQLYSSAYVSVATKTPMIGTIGVANGYGDLLTLGIIATLFLLQNAKPLSRSWALLWKMGLILTGILMLAAILFNGSRGAFFALICSLTATLFLNRRTEHLIEGKFLALKFLRNRVTILLFSIVGLSVILWGLHRLNPESSFGRLMIWSISAPMVIEHPLRGIGYYQYEVEYLNYQAAYFAKAAHSEMAYKAVNIKQADNDYLQAFCETGIIGGILYLLAFFLPLYYLFRHIQSANAENESSPANGVRAQEWRTGTEASALFAILIALLVHAFFDAPFHIVPTLTVAYIIFGLIPIDKCWTFHLSRGKLFTVAILTALYLSFCTNKVLAQYQGHQEWAKGYEFAQKRHFDWAINHYQRALPRLPDECELQFHLGSALVLAGSYSQGLFHLKSALRGYNDRNIYLSESYACLQLGSLNKAEESAKTALAMFPDQLGPRLLLAQIYLAMGDTFKSKQSLEKCIRGETTIWSHDVEQVRDNARRLWDALQQNTHP